MSTLRWIIGCALFAACSPSFASSASSDFGTRDGAGQQAVSQGTSSRNVDSGSTIGGGDATTSSAPAANDAPASASSDAGGDPGSMPASSGARQPTPHHSSIGWQSLLPGSIQ